MLCSSLPGNVVNQYKGFAGGIRSIQSCSSGERSYVVTCGLDRYLRVYNMHPPKLLHQVGLQAWSVTHYLL